jgi:hypothetical protein
MSYAVAIWANTSSNQAIKDPGQRRCGYSNLGKIVIKFVAAKRIAATFVAVRDLAGKSRFPISSEQSKKLPVRSSPSFSDRGCQSVGRRHGWVD